MANYISKYTVMNIYLTERACLDASHISNFGQILSNDASSQRSKVTMATLKMGAILGAYFWTRARHRDL
jgi:hypothetical protein